MSTRRWQATYAALCREPSIGAYRTLQAHAKSWHEARQKLPRYIYPAGRRYRRIAGPTTEEN